MNETTNFDINLGKNDIEVNLGQNEIEIELPGGARGLKGDTGSQGPQGIQGPQGPQGTPGKDGKDGQDGKSGVWVGESEPTDEEYVVWIDPDGTQSTIPTKTSDLTNDSGFITAEKIGYTERLTNKIYVDSNNVEHPVYCKTIAIDLDEATDVTIGGYTYKGIAHNISNYSRAFSTTTYTNDYYGVEATFSGYPYSNSTYLLFLNDDYYNIKEVYFEYIKTS